MIKGIGDYTRPAFAGASKKNAKVNLTVVLNLLNENESNKDLPMEAITNFHLVILHISKKTMKWHLIIWIRVSAMRHNIKEPAT